MMSTGKILSKETQAFLRKLRQLDLGPIAYTLVRKGWTCQQIMSAIARYLIFLLLIYLYPTQKIVPSSEVDAIWHHHILDTAKYTEDCHMLFGYYVHHFPYFGQRDEADQQQLCQSFSETQALLEQHSKMLLASHRLMNENEGSCASQASGCCLRNEDLVRPSVLINLDALLQQSLLE